MSVIVKGMKKPKCCRICDFNTFSMYCRRTGSEIDRDYEWRETLPDCPISILPDKHGRVIDEDDVINAIHERLHELQTHKEFIKKRGDIDLLGILPYIAKIHTIIEAEGGS